MTTFRDRVVRHQPRQSRGQLDELAETRRLNIQLALQNTALRNENHVLAQKLRRAERRAHRLLIHTLALQAAYRSLRLEFGRLGRRARRLARSTASLRRSRNDNSRIQHKPWNSAPVPIPHFKISGRALAGTLTAIEGTEDRTLSLRDLD